MADVFTEVEEALRQERLQKFWTNYGVWLIGGIALLILGTAAWSGWRAWTQHVNAAQTEILTQARDSADPVKELSAITDELQPSLQAIALHLAANEKLAEGAAQDALDLFMQIAAINGAPHDLRDLAILEQSRLEWSLPRTEEQDFNIQPLLKLAETPSSPWYPAARLLAAEITAHQDQNYALALQYLTPIMGNVDLPQSLSQRANMLWSVYSVRQAEARAKQNQDEKDS